MGRLHQLSRRAIDCRLRHARAVRSTGTRPTHRRHRVLHRSAGVPSAAGSSPGPRGRRGGGLCRGTCTSRRGQGDRRGRGGAGKRAPAPALLGQARLRIVDLDPADLVLAKLEFQPGQLPAEPAGLPVCGVKSASCVPAAGATLPVERQSRDRRRRRRGFQPGNQQPLDCKPLRRGFRQVLVTWIDGGASPTVNVRSSSSVKPARAAAAPRAASWSPKAAASRCRTNRSPPRPIRVDLSARRGSSVPGPAAAGTGPSPRRGHGRG